MGDKAILVTRDPVFVNKNVINGRYIGVRPHTYLPLAIAVTVLNPLLGPVGILFAYMSTRSYNDGDLRYSQKWAGYAFMWSMLTIGASVILYCAIGFNYSELSITGSHSP